MPNGAAAPGNMFTGPTTSPPLPVPMNGSTSAVGSPTSAVSAVAAGASAANSTTDSPRPSAVRLMLVITSFAKQVEFVQGKVVPGLRPGVDHLQEAGPRRVEDDRQHAGGAHRRSVRNGQNRGVGGAVGRGLDVQAGRQVAGRQRGVPDDPGQRAGRAEVDAVVHARRLHDVAGPAGGRVAVVAVAGGGVVRTGEARPTGGRDQPGSRAGGEPDVQRGGDARGNGG